jgi:hypothetical protein
VNEKKSVTFVIPDDLTEMSVSAIKLCELFASKLLNTTDSVIEIKVDEKNKLVTSRNHQIKELVSMYLKSRRLESFYKQLISLASTTVATNEIELKLLVGDKIFLIGVRELNALPNLHLCINKAELAMQKQ